MINKKHNQLSTLINSLKLKELTSREKIITIGGDAEHLKRYLWVIPIAFFSVMITHDFVAGYLANKIVSKELAREVAVETAALAQSGLSDADKMNKLDFIALKTCVQQIFRAKPYKRKITIGGGVLGTFIGAAGVALYNTAH